MSTSRAVDKEIWYIYTMEHYSAIKKKERMAFAATWMDLEIIMLSEVRQQDANIVCYHLYVESKKKRIQWTSLQNRYWFKDLLVDSLTTEPRQELLYGYSFLMTGGCIYMLSHWPQTLPCGLPSFQLWVASSRGRQSMLCHSVHLWHHRHHHCCQTWVQVCLVKNYTVWEFPLRCISNKSA